MRILILLDRQLLSFIFLLVVFVPRSYLMSQIFPSYFNTVFFCFTTEIGWVLARIFHGCHIPYVPVPNKEPYSVIVVGCCLSYLFSFICLL